METRNPDYRQAAAAIFTAAGFIVDLGIEPVTISPGFVEARLVLQDRHLQQDRFVHAGVQSTLADHTAGAAAFTAIRAEQIVLTTGFSISLMTAAEGEELRARAHLLKAGQRVIFAESSVFAVRSGQEKLVARAQVTLAVLPRPE